MIRRNRARSLFIWLVSLSVAKQGAHLEDHSQFGCYTISTLKMTGEMHPLYSGWRVSRWSLQLCTMWFGSPYNFTMCCYLQRHSLHLQWVLNLGAEKFDCRIQLQIEVYLIWATNNEMDSDWRLLRVCEQPLVCFFIACKALNLGFVHARLIVLKHVGNNLLQQSLQITWELSWDVDVQPSGHKQDNKIR